MPIEIMKYFLEQVIDCCDDFSSALTVVLQYYDITAAEKEFIADSRTDHSADYGGGSDGRKK